MYVAGLEGNPRFPQFVPAMGWNMGEDSFHRAQLRVLIIFPSSLEVRVISNTHTTLYNIIKDRFGDAVFVDFWMEPPRYNKVYLKKHFPWVTGYLSKHTWEDFDVLAFSLSVAMSEFIGMAEILRDARIPAWSRDRIGDNKMPLLVAGGVAVDGTSMLDNVVDLFMLGMGERTFPTLIGECFKAQARLGSVSKGKEAVIGACQTHKGFYNPKLYHYSTRVVGGRIENVYEGCDVPELREVEPDVSLPAEVLETSDWQRYLPVPGRSHKASLQVSLGCGGARGTCNFDFAGHTLISTSEGLVSLEGLYERHKAGTLGGVRALNPKTGDYEDIAGVFRVREADVWRLTLNDGSSVEVTPDHDLVDENWNVRLAKDFKVGDSLNVQFNRHSLRHGGHDFTRTDGWVSAGFIAGLFLRFGAYDHRGMPYLSFNEFPEASRFIGRFMEAGAIELLGYGASGQLYGCRRDEYRALLLSLFYGRANSGAPDEIDLGAFSRMGLGDFMAFAYALMAFSGETTIHDDDMPLGLVIIKGFSKGLLRELQIVFHYYGVPCILSSDDEGEEDRVLLLNCHSFGHIPEWVFGWDLDKDIARARDAAIKGESVCLYDKGWESRIRRIEYAGRQVTYNLTVEPSHLVQCNGHISSSQCHEGSLYGAWRERTPEDIRKGLMTSKRSSMGESFSFMSFNGNFLSDFAGSIKDAASYFHRLTSLQFRMDALAASVKVGGRDNYLSLLKELKTVSVSCLHSTSYVTTRLGMVPIDRLAPGDYVWAPSFGEDNEGSKVSSDFGWREVQAVIPQGKKALYRVVTRNGISIIATADHRFVSIEEGDDGRVTFHDTEVKDLEGRKVMLTSIPEEFQDAHNVLSFKGTDFDRLTEDLAFLLGWFCSSGRINGEEEIIVNAAKSGYMVFSDLVRALKAYGIKFEVEKVKGKYGEDRRVIIRSPVFYGFLVDVDAVRGDGVRKKFPNLLYGMPTEVILAFLRGFFASRVRFSVERDDRDGRVFMSCKCLHSLPRSMAYHVQRIVNGLGFVNRLVRSSESEEKLYKMFFMGNVQDFYKRCGFDRYYQVWDKPSPSPGVPFDIVESVEYWGEDDCWDITVEGSPYFVANGIVSHNCPLESISERGRRFLNKNLSEDDILTVSDEVFRLRFIKLKHSAIFTGYEAKEDYDEHRELCQRLVSMRDERGANTVISFNSSMLIHMYGTPLYYVPRKSAAIAWRQFFAKMDGETFYFNPFVYLNDLGVKVKLAGRPYDTILQQVQQDMSREFLEEAILKPTLEGKLECWSDDVLASIRDTMRRWGVSPRAQFLEADFTKNPRQHLRVGFFDRNYDKFSGGDALAYSLSSKDKDFEGHGFCLRTPATELKGSLVPCIGCRSCGDIDKERSGLGLAPADGRTHSMWMHERSLGDEGSVLDIKSEIIANSPSFYYCFVFDMDRRTVGISKEGLIRRWLSRAADVDESIITNFRHIKSALFKGLEFPHWISLYYGVEVAVIGFRDALDLEKMEGIRKEVNQALGDSGVQCVGNEPQQSSDFSIDCILASVELVNPTGDEVKRFAAAVDEPHRVYYTQRQPRFFECPFMYKLVSRGGKVTVVYLMPPKFSLVWSEGTKVWQQTMVMDKMANWRVHGAFRRTGDGTLVDIVTGKAFHPEGFIGAGRRGEDAFEEEELGVELVSS